MHISRLAVSLGAVVVLAAVGTTARAELVYGVTDAAAPALVAFDSSTPSFLTGLGSVTGIVSGQSLRSIDFRASNGQLYALSSSGTSAQLYTINTSTAAATAVGSGFTLTGNTSSRVSIDFNPVVDALRVVTGGGQSYRVNPATGALIAQDTSLSPSASLISGIAYSNNAVGTTSTTLYAYNYIDDTVDTIGGVGGSPSPNGGVVTLVGSSGLTSVIPEIGFDISGTSDIAYLSLDDASTATAASEFYGVNLATGAANFIGGSTASLLDISVAVAAVPEASTWTMMMGGFGLMAMALHRCRRPSRDDHGRG